MSPIWHIIENNLDVELRDRIIELYSEQLPVKCYSKTNGDLFVQVSKLRRLMDL